MPRIILFVAALIIHSANTCTSCTCTASPTKSQSQSKPVARVSRRNQQCVRLPNAVPCRELYVDSVAPALVCCFSVNRPSFVRRIHLPSPQSALGMTPKNPNGDAVNKSKRLILIRHGCTYMNEYLATPGSKWGDADFTDVFHPSDVARYRDSPLSEKGNGQAQELHEFLHGAQDGRSMLRDIELVAVSPLTRTLQTLEFGVLPHLRTKDPRGSRIPIIALPLASERVYLISDHGNRKESLAAKFPFADFSQEFDRFGDDWWFTVKECTDEEDHPNIHSFTSTQINDYVEWRPSDDNQKYACHGEPDGAFEDRMMELYKWLEARKEGVICLVCHFGTLQWLTGEELSSSRCLF